MRTIRRLAIVNRGEPAMRALAAVAELNEAGDAPPISTIVVHTDPDAQAWYVREADEGLSLGPATYVDPADGHRKSRYLDEPAVIEALRRAEVDAVWVGWGFLAEQASFAQRCEEAGILFVGPDSATIRLLGDKMAAKRLAERVDVPVARHIEVQVIGDDYGTTWAAGVRDCTIQRRHQKVIEESSSPALDPATERAIKDAAVRLAAAAGYRNAGTVEFLVDPHTDDFMFMEVNTRLQVEHPVTEQTTGLDLVKLQLYVARGGRLDGQAPAARGHAIEARLCAEDPENGFAPAPGRLAVLAMPTGPGIRVDTGVREGDVVAPDFDSMIAKIVAWGHDRAEAIGRLRRALAQTTAVVEGGTTNRSFLLALLDRPEVRAGDLDNHWLDRLTAAGGHLPAADPVALLQAAVEAYEADQAVDRAAFHARAARGRPEPPGEIGHACQLRYRGVPYALRVFRTGPHTYRIDAGTPLVRIRASAVADGGAGSTAALDLGGLRMPEPANLPPCDRVYGALRSYLLGYDLDPSTVRGLHTRQRRLGEVAPPADPGLLRCEDGLLDLFADVGSLYRPRAETEPEDALTAGSTQEYLLSYLQWLDPDRAGLPDHYRERLERALHRYGISGLERTPALEEAVVWMFRSFSRVEELVPVVAGILDRRLRNRDTLAHLADADTRARLDRLAAAAQGRHQVVADLARDVRFTHLDEPLLEKAIRDEYAIVDGHLDALRTDPDRADRRERLDRLVASPQPLRGTLLRSWLAREDDRFRQVVLELYTRRYYRIRDLRALSCTRYKAHLICSADYDLDGRSVHLVVAYAPLAELPGLSTAVAAHLAGTDPDREVVVDVTTWRGSERPEGDLIGEIDELLRDCDFGRRLRRLDVTVTSTAGAVAEHLRTRHVTFRQAADGTFAEDRLYRDLHPMLGKRLDLWRLANFELERLPSAEDVYLFHGVAHDNPADHRLFALAEVRDLTPVPNGVGPAGTVTYPRLELMGLRALSAMRQALAGFPAHDRPVANRIVLDVRPLWTVPARAWPVLARSLAPLAVGAGLEKVVVRVHIPDPDGGIREAVLHVEGLGGHGVTVRERPAGQDPIRPLTPYRQKVLRAQRFGAPYPYEIVRMLAPPPGALGRFPIGRFVEYDLDGTGALVPVSRLPGHNTANVVVGLITNDTAKVPEGMTRVALLGDPTRGLGNLAEPECRRIIAALDLAERLGVPVEWFALSSGARIAMDSGTENMDWISAVLRRLIEYTQAGGEVNIIVTGVNVGAQPYWNAEATMLMHTKGILVMTPDSTMVLTGKQALDFSGGVSAEDNFGIGGFDRVMGPNGQAQYWAPTLEDACDILLAHYDHTYVVPGEAYPRRTESADPVDRDVRTAPHPALDGGDLTTVGDVFSSERNADRKKPFDIRAVMRAVSDEDCRPLERWAHWRGADTAVVWDAHIGGIPVCLLGVESHTVTRRGFVPADGPPSWNSGTLFPQSSRKLARAINAASGNRPLVVLANLSGFDGSPESMRRWQLEYGAEIGRAITNFHGPIVFVVVSRYHGGAFVVFSKRLNERMEIAAVEGSYASVIGGAPAAATVFAREVKSRTEADPRVRDLQDQLRAAVQDPAAPEATAGGLRARLAETTARVRSEKLGEVADEFDRVHSIQRALAVGSVDRIIPARELRPYLVDALERGMAGRPAAG